MNEAYLGTARKRVSLARHARLVDYHVHEGNQSSTWLAVDVLDGQTPFTLATRSSSSGPGTASRRLTRVFFATRERRAGPAERTARSARQRLRLHTWRNAQPALRAGSTSADVVSTTPTAGQAEAETLRDSCAAARSRGF